MSLNEKEIKKIKALHVTTKIPIFISDKNFRCIKKYCSNKKRVIPYDFSCRNIPNSGIWYDYGIFNEIFLSIEYKDSIITLGPFLTNSIPKEKRKTLMQISNIKNILQADKEEYLKYYNSLPTYSLGDIRDFIVILDSLFNMDLEQNYSKSLHLQVSQNELKIEDEFFKNITTNFVQPEKYMFYYENKIMKLVSQGDLASLRQGIANIGCSVIPKLTSDPIRSEKNYTIVILEKLSSLVIYSGKDVIDTLRLRDFYIRKVESQKNLVEILAVRDSAIIHFTKELHDFSNTKYSPLIISMMQYVNLKIYDSFKASELAKHFFMSESAVRRRFKNEVGMYIKEYINMRKITLAKTLLRANVPISEISERLGFFDSSHFHRSFKTIEGISPKQYQKNLSDIKNLRNTIFNGDSDEDVD